MAIKVVYAVVCDVCFESEHSVGADDIANAKKWARDDTWKAMRVAGSRTKKDVCPCCYHKILSKEQVN